MPWLLTYVSTLELDMEQGPDLLLSRQKLLDQKTKLRKHIQIRLRRNRRHYKCRDPLQNRLDLATLCLA